MHLVNEVKVFRFTRLQERLVPRRLQAKRQQEPSRAGLALVRRSKLHLAVPVVSMYLVNDPGSLALPSAGLKRREQNERQEHLRLALHEPRRHSTAAPCPMLSKSDEKVSSNTGHEVSRRHLEVGIKIIPIPINPAQLRAI